MDILEIRAMQTTLDHKETLMPNPPRGWHESLFRSYQILEKVKIYLRGGMPGEFVYELIETMEGKEKPDATSRS